MKAPAPRFLGYCDDAATVARRLLGQRLVRVIDGQRLAGLIVETEAYLGAKDRAAHTFNGRRTRRNESMYLPGGHAYVYFTYGMHYCFNVVCGAGQGTAVLIRAIEPTEGVERMWAARPAARIAEDLCSGPAKLTLALRIDRTLDGEDLRASPRLFLERLRDRAIPADRIEVSARVGVQYAGEWAAKPLRFSMAGNRYVSPVRTRFGRIRSRRQI
jgi:DNA-3-methyladenine glycosylase